MKNEKKRLEFMFHMSCLSLNLELIMMVLWSFDRLVFDGDKEKALRPRVSQQRGSGASGITSVSLISLLLTGLLIAVVH